MAERMYSDEFIFWVKATLGLQITKDALCSFIEKHMTEFVKLLSNDQEDHLRTKFFQNKLLPPGRVKYRHASKHGGEIKWSLQSNCTRCCDMFAKILENHTKKGHKSINWQCHPPSEQYSAPAWWIIAKIFMPGINKSCMGPQEADPLALFSLIMNCKLFTTLSSYTQEVIEVRNYLMHHPSNTINEKEMRDAMNKMKTLLQQERVQDTSTMALNDIEKLEQDPIILTKLSKENIKLVEQALQLKSSSIEYDIQESLSKGKSTVHLELELQKTKDAIVKEKDEIETVKETNAKLKEEYQLSQKCYNDECAQRQLLEKKIVQLHKKLSDADEQEQRIINESESLTEEIKQLRRIRDLYNDECGKSQQLDQEIAFLRRKLSEAPKENIWKSVITGAITGGTVGLASGLRKAVIGAAVGGLVGVATAALDNFIKDN